VEVCKALDLSSGNGLRKVGGTFLLETGILDVGQAAIHFSDASLDFQGRITTRRSTNPLEIGLMQM